jgi:rubrerythrin
MNLPRRRKPQKTRQPVMCEECGIYPADLPSKTCPGCAAYREHQA